MANLTIPMTAAQLAGVKKANKDYNSGATTGGVQPSGGELTQDQFMTLRFQPTLEQMANAVTSLPSGQFLARFKGAEIKWLFDAVGAPSAADTFIAYVTAGPTVSLLDNVLTAQVLPLFQAMEAAGVINVGQAATRAAKVLDF